MTKTPGHRVAMNVSYCLYGKNLSSCTSVCLATMYVSDTKCKGKRKKNWCVLYITTITMAEAPKSKYNDLEEFVTNWNRL